MHSLQPVYYLNTISPSPWEVTIYSQARLSRVTGPFINDGLLHNGTQ